jgi:hypothetical protein
MYTKGGFTCILWAGLFFFFHLHEPPKYLIRQGPYVKATEVINSVAVYNSTSQPLTVEMFEQVERDHIGRHCGIHAVAPVDRKIALKRSFAAFKPGGLRHVCAFFSTLKLVYSFTLILLIWGMVELASPLQ